MDDPVNVDPNTHGDHHQQPHPQPAQDDQPPPPPLDATMTSITTPAAADPKIEKISQEQVQEVPTIPAPSSPVAAEEIPAVPSLQQDAAAVAPDPAAVEAPPAPLPEAETVPTCDDIVVVPAETPESAASPSLAAAPPLALEIEPQLPGPVEHLPEVKQGLEGSEAELVGTEPENNPDSVSDPTESDEKLEAAVVEGEAAVKVEPPLEKTELEGEVKDILPQAEEVVPEIESNPKKVVEIEDREIEPVLSTEAAAEPAEALKDLPVADSTPEKKEEPEEVAEPQVEEKVVPGPVDEVADEPREEYSESAVGAEVAETVPSKDVAEDKEVVDQTANEPEVEPTTNKKVAEALTETIVPDAEKDVAVEVNNADEGLPDGEAEKLEEEGGVEETIANHDELVSGGTENGTNEVEEKLEAGSEQVDEIKHVAKEVKAEDVTEEKTEKLVELVSGGTEYVADESAVKEEAEVVKAEGATAEKIENPEGLVSNPEELVSNKTEDGTNLMENKLKDESPPEKETEVTKEVHESAENAAVKAGDVGGSTLVKDVADEPSESKAECPTTTTTTTGGDVTNLSESAKEEEKEAEAEAGKPNDSVGLEPQKAEDSESLPVTTEVVTKSTTAKSSGNIMSKVKQSIVKVKKAIIGKSPAKAEEKVK